MAPLSKRLGAEFLGTFWLVFAGCGSAVLAATATTDAGFPVGIGYVGVALTFGLSVVTMAYAVGSISGGHFNPAVTLGLAVAGRFEWKDVLPYWCTQIVSGLVGGGVLYAIASGTDTFDVVKNGFAANGYGAHSPSGYGLGAAFLCEVVMTFIFLIVIIGTTDSRANAGFAPLAIGLGLYTPLGVWGVFLARSLDEVAKVLVFEWRKRRLNWLKLAQEQQGKEVVAAH